MDSVRHEDRSSAKPEHTQSYKIARHGSMVDIQSPTAEIRRGKKERRKRKIPQDENIYGLPYYTGRP